MLLWQMYDFLLAAKVPVNVQSSVSLQYTDEVMMSKIYVTRGHKVMLNEDLATLYGVETHHLNEQMKRNTERFTEDFMFILSEHEFADLMSHFATSSWAEEESNLMTLLKIELLFTYLSKFIEKEEQPHTEIGFKRKGK